MFEFIHNEHFWTILEYFGVATGLIYLYLEIKQKPAMWLVGGICSLIYIFVFAVSKIYADMCFNIYNVIISIYGLVLWLRHIDGEKKEDSKQLEYMHIQGKSMMIYGGITVIIYGIIYYLLRTFTDSPIPLGDAFTTTLSITATYLLAKRYIEHWILWMIINFVSVYLYYLRGLYPTMGLYVFYVFKGSVIILSFLCV